MNGKKQRLAFSLLEMLVALTVLLMIMVMLFGVVSGITSVWSGSMQRVDAFQGARVAFDRVTKMLSQATMNVYWDYDNPNNPTVYRRQSELAFAVLQTGTDGFSGGGTGHGVFFQVPVGATERTAGPDFRPLSQMLSSVGFSVRWVGDKNIRPPFIEGPEKFRLRLVQYRGLSEKLSVYNDPSDENPRTWIDLLEPLPLADNIVLFAVWPRLSEFQDPDGNDLTPDFTYNSRKGARLVPQPITANQLPPTLQVTMIAIDERTALRLPGNGFDSKILDAYSGCFERVEDYQSDMKRIAQRLSEAGINFRVFTTTVQLRESRWSP